nr:DUF3592 domain-containing protein [Streptomyces sp. SID161]
MIELCFYVVPGLVLAALAFAAYRLVRRARRIGRTWSHGLTAEARCLRTYTTTSGGGGDTSVHTSLHHVYEFRARDGRTVRFEEEGGPATVLEGDITTVRYLPECPERATARPPAPGRLVGEAGCGLLFLGVAGAVCVGFIILAHGIFAESDGLLP